MSRRSGLGRGLGALIPAAEPSSSATSALRDVPIAQIRPNQFQPRKQFDEETLGSLVDSIKAVGVLQPILVREVAEGDYELIAGERRFRAARRAGLGTVPALVRTVDDVTSLEQALVENVHREDLNALDEAGAYQQLIEDFGLTHEDVARRVGRSRTAVTNSLRLFQLPPSVQRLVRDSRLSAGHARALLGTPDRLVQEQLAGEAVRQSLSVRAIEQMVRRLAADEAENEPSPAHDADESAGPSGTPTPPSPPPPETAEHRSSELRPPGVADLEELLGDHLNTRVRVDMGGKHGRVIIEFATLDDLERIYRDIIGASTGRPQTDGGLGLG